MLSYDELLITNIYCIRNQIIPLFNWTSGCSEYNEGYFSGSIYTILCPCLRRNTLAKLLNTSLAMEGPKLFMWAAPTPAPSPVIRWPQNSTGATGYIGGSVLSKIVETHPEFQITALMRNATSDFTSKYPNVSVVQGTFDDFEVIENAAQDAEIVIRRPLILSICFSPAELASRCRRYWPSRLRKSNLVRAGQENVRKLPHPSNRHGLHLRYEWAVLGG